jgi:hypothetical protein
MTFRTCIHKRHTDCCNQVQVWVKNVACLGAVTQITRSISTCTKGQRGSRSTISMTQQRSEPNVA